MNLVDDIMKKYAPKRLQGAIYAIYKTMDGYEVLLNPFWLFERNNTMFFTDNIATLRSDFKYIQYHEKDEYVEIMQGMNYHIDEISAIMDGTASWGN